MAALAGFAVLVSAWVPGIALAEPDARLAEARAELVRLEGEMQVRRDEAQELEERLAWVNGLVDEGESRYDTLSGQLAQVQREIQRSELHVESLQGRFDSIVRQQFMDGGTTPLSVMFEEDDTETM